MNRAEIDLDHPDLLDRSEHSDQPGHSSHPNHLDDPNHSEHNVPTAGSDRAGSVAGTHPSGHYASSASDTSDAHAEYRRVDLHFPHEVLEEEELHPADSASESHPRPPRRHTLGPGRAYSGQRSRRTRPPQAESPDSVDYSGEEDVGGPGYQPGPRHHQSYYGPMQPGQIPTYSQSSSSGASYIYPQVHGPSSSQMVQFASHPPLPAMGPYGPSYSQQPGGGYPPHQPYPMNHHPAPHLNSPYTASPYGGQQMIPFSPTPPMYYPPQYLGGYPAQPPWEPYQRVPPSVSPQPPGAFAPERQHVSPPPSAASPPVDQDDVVRRFEKMFLKEREDREAKEAAREAATRAAAEEAVAKADRATLDAKIADEAAAKAREEAIRVTEAKASEEIAKVKAEAEAKTLKTAAEAERAVHEAKIAEDAAAKAREEFKREAEAKAAADAEKAKADAEANAARAASDAKIAKEAADNARKEMEEAARAAAAPKDKQAPIRFKDALERKFNFPFHLCVKWKSMELLIRQAFANVPALRPYIEQGRYDLHGPSGEIILPQVWENVVEPDFVVTMNMWPLPEPRPPPQPPPPGPEVVNPGEALPRSHRWSGHRARKPHPPSSHHLVPPPPPPAPMAPGGAGGATVNATAPLPPLVPGGKEVNKTNKKPGPPKPGPTKPGSQKKQSSFGFWMLGGKPAKPPPKAVKVPKKPNGAAGPQPSAPTNNGVPPGM